MTPAAGAVAGWAAGFGLGAGCSAFLEGAKIACSVVPSMRGMNSTIPASPMSWMEAIDDLVAKGSRCDIWRPLKRQAGFDLVALGEEADGLVLLGHGEVVLVHRDRKLDFLNDDDLLLLAGSAVAFIFFVEEFPVVLDLADRRDGVGRDFDEIQRTLARNLQGVERRHDAQLFTVFVDDADFASTDALIGADERLLRTFIERWNRSISGTPVGRAFVLKLDAPARAGATGQGGFKCSTLRGVSGMSAM